MTEFKDLVLKAFNEDIYEIKNLSGSEQQDVCFSYFEEKRGVDAAVDIISTLFGYPLGYLLSSYKSKDAQRLSHEVQNAFALEVGVLRVVGPGPDMTCEFQPNGKRWDNELDD